MFIFVYSIQIHTIHANILLLTDEVVLSRPRVGPASAPKIYCWKECLDSAQTFSWK